MMRNHQQVYIISSKYVQKFHTAKKGYTHHYCELISWITVKNALRLNQNKNESRDNDVNIHARNCLRFRNVNWHEGRCVPYEQQLTSRLKSNSRRFQLVSCCLSHSLTSHIITSINWGTGLAICQLQDRVTSRPKATHFTPLPQTCVCPMNNLQTNVKYCKQDWAINYSTV